MTKIPYKFFTACSTGKVEVVKDFLASGVPPDATDKYHLTGLIWAGRKGRTEVARVLLENGADIEGTDRRGRTALFHAVTYQRYEFVSFLKDRGADLSPTDTHGWTPLDFSRASRHKKMEALLVEFRAVAKVYDAS